MTLTKKRPDLVVSGGGSLYTLDAFTRKGIEWVEENVDRDNAFQPYWPSSRSGLHRLVIEHRYIRDIVLGAVQDGLVVR